MNYTQTNDYPIQESQISSSINSFEKVRTVGRKKEIKSDGNFTCDV